MTKRLPRHHSDSIFHVAQATASLDALRSPDWLPTPLARVEAAQALAFSADQVLNYAVLQARDDGATWQQIADVFGTSRQAAHDRWGHVDR